MRCGGSDVGPWRGPLRALERNILVYRSLQMMLVIFYAQQLNDDVIGAVEATNRFVDVAGMPKRSFDKRVKGAAKTAFRALVSAGVLTVSEAAEMRRLVDFRNRVAHELEDLFADLSNEAVARDHIRFSKAWEGYDYGAVERLQHYQALLSTRLVTHMFASMLDMRPLVFRAAERAFLQELKRLRRRIDRLQALRRAELDALRLELTVEGTELVDQHHPRGPLTHYDGGRLTARGIEVCYRLFDRGKSNTAVAYIAELSLPAVRRRRRAWLAAGGTTRPVVDLDALPKRKFYVRYDD